MRKSFAYFFLTCSLILVLGHSILPHSHEEQVPPDCEITEAKDLSIADIIKLALAHNIGTNHLEEFKNCNKPGFPASNSFDFSLSSILSNDLILNLTLSQKIASPANQIIIPAITSLNAPLRAPPALS